MFPKEREGDRMSDRKLETASEHNGAAGKGISRRDALKAAAALGIGVMGAGALGACSPGESSGSDAGKSDASATWDKTADIVVVGTGTAAVAALAASDFGAESVIVLEKSTVFGGTSSLSGGGVGIPLSHIAEAEGIADSMDEVLKYYASSTNGRCNLDVAKSYAENGDKYMLWAEDTIGVTWKSPGLLEYYGGTKMFQDYYEPCEGWLEWGRGNIGVAAIDGDAASGGASGMWAKMQSMIDADEKIELLMGTAAIELVQDGDGTVVGIVADDGRSQMRIQATKGVILGTGGFEHDADMRRKFMPFPLLASSSVPTNTGDGHKMGMRIGADLSNMDKSWGLPHFLVAGEDAYELLKNGELVADIPGQDPGTYRSMPGCVVVNKRGERFGNESASYPVFNRAFGAFDNYYADYTNIPGFFICDSTYAGTYRLPGQAKPTDPIPEIFVSADTLEELAGKLGIDPDRLTAEMTAFNENAKNGVDPKFNRGGHKFDVNTAGPFAGNRTDIPNPVLAPVEVGPFYGAIIVPGCFGTSGGLTIDPNSQVVDVDGNPIAGLYAVGNCSSGVTAGTYCSGGMTVGQGSVMSWVAARHALGVTD